MSTIEAAVMGSKKIEKILKDQFQAEGRGLHELLTSVESRIPADILKQARYIASVRNKVVHEDGDIDDISAFKNTVEEVTTGLEKVLFIEEREAAARRQRETVEIKTASPQPVAFETKLLLGIFGLIALVSLTVCMKLKQDLDKVKKSHSSIENLVSKLEKDIETKDKIINSLKTMHAKIVKEGNMQTAKIQRGSSNTKLIASSPASQTSSKNSLLAKAMKSGSEFEQAKAEIKEGLLQTIKSNISLSTGDLEVSQEKGGTYSIRVPVSWNINPRVPLKLINEYFDSYKGRPIALSSGHMSRDKNRIVVSESYADSSSSPKPYSGRLFDIMQSVEIRLVASLGNKSSFITIAGNVDCHVSCSYSEKPSNYWLLLTQGGFRKSTIVISGLTKNDLEKYGEPVIKIIQV